MCPIKTNRKANPGITAKNEKGETVAFCCNGCKNKFTAALPASAKRHLWQLPKPLHSTKCAPSSPTVERILRLPPRTKEERPWLSVATVAKTSSAASLPLPSGNMMGMGMKDTVASSGNESYKRKGTPTRDMVFAGLKSGTPPRGHAILQFEVRLATRFKFRTKKQP